MVIRSKEQVEELLKQFDGQLVQRFHSPFLFEAKDVAKVSETFPNYLAVSPGFNVLRKLIICSTFAQSGELVYPDIIHDYEKREIKAMKNSKLPSVGTELEIPYSIDLSEEQKEGYRRLVQLGIPYDQESCRWEFSLPWSYSWKTQALLIHTLLNMQYIPYDQSNFEPSWKGRQIPDFSHFSLHYNLGLPAGIILGSTNRSVFLNDAKYLAMACGLAFSSPQRLLTRKTPLEATIDKSCESTCKSGRRGYNRVEIRTLGFGITSSYRQLAIIQEVGVAFMEYHKEAAFSDIRLALLWDRLRNRFSDLFDKHYGVSEVFNDQDPSDRQKLADILEGTDIRQETWKCLHSVAALVKSIIKDY